MAGISFFGAKGGGGGGGGIRKVLDAPARLALLPTAGDFVVQLDTNDLWYYNGTAWELFVEDLDNNDIDQLQTDLANHLADTVDAHDASAISVVPGGSISSTNVQNALAEVAADAANELNAHEIAPDPHPQYATDTDLTDHLTDTTNAHEASAISFGPAGSISATNVQAAIQELDSEVDARLDTLEAASHAAVTLGAVGTSPNSNGASLSGQVLTLQPASSGFPGLMTTTGQSFVGNKIFQNKVTVGSPSSSSPNAIFEANSTVIGARPAPTLSTAVIGAMPVVSGQDDGVMAYNPTFRSYQFYNGTNFSNIGSAHPSPLQSVIDTIIPVERRFQMLPVVGSGGVHRTVTAFQGPPSFLDGDICVLVGTSDSATLEILSTATNVVLNGSIILANNDTLTLMYYNSAWREIARRD